MEDLGIQLQAVKSLNLKEYSESSHLDRVWMEICDKLEGILEGKADALIKFVKIICSLPHSNSFLERGFSDHKQIVEGRESLFLASTNGIRQSLDFIRLAGGST